jgi:putative acetyltransferase
VTSGDPAPFPSGVRIRLEEPPDREAGLEVERAAFGGPDEADIVVAVRDLEGSFALVAEEIEGGRIVGHVQLSRAWVGDDPVSALGPIGVLPDAQRRGTAGSLVRAALVAASDRGEIAVILLGSTGFYPRFGFEPASAYGLRNPFTGTQEDGFVVQEGDFMLAPLDGRASSLRGSVRWHPAFGEPTVRE